MLAQSVYSKEAHLNHGLNEAIQKKKVSKNIFCIHNLPQKWKIDKKEIPIHNPIM